MKPGMTISTSNADARLEKALDGLFAVFEKICEGAIAVDRDANVVVINGKYQDLLRLDDPAACLGKPIERIIPNSQLRHVAQTGEAMLLDVMDVGDQSIVVTRMPVFDEDSEEILGAVGFVLYDQLNYLKPTISKYAEAVKSAEQAQRELAHHRRAKYTFNHIIGNGPKMTELKRQARRAAQVDTTIMLLGETGTGKELLAHAIHAASGRAHGAFIGLNVAAIPEDLMEAELFGAAPGAYTGASKTGRKGKFQLANGGTLFLDEIGDMPLALQSKLLRVLQEREIEALGSNRLEKVDVRVIAATSRDLQQMVEDGEFRPDLYFRLNVLPLSLPPLRERKEDLAELCGALLEQIAIDSGAPPRSLQPDGLACVAWHNWPGNIRELRNVLERVSTLTDHQRLSAASFAGILESPPDGITLPETGLPGLDELMRETERNAIETALHHAGGKKSKAAKLLGISRSSLYEKLEKHGMTRG